VGGKAREKSHLQVGRRTSGCKEAREKKVHWETTLGRQGVVVQRFLIKGKLIVPFCDSARVTCRDYSMLLERVITDFGADVSFGQTVEKLKEHYGIIISTSAVQSITKQHAKACYEMLEQESKTPGNKNADCLIGEVDGVMIPVLFFEPNESADKRRWRKTGWKEARLSVARKHRSLTRVFLATMGSTDRAGQLLGRCAKRLGWGEKTRIHCVGDGAKWIKEQVDKVFGTQATYLVDFFHLSEYLAQAAEKCCKEAPRKWLKAQQIKMRNGKIAEVIKELEKQLEPEEIKDEEAAVRRCYRYMENRRGQFKYREALREELPIGSGEIESGNRSVIQKRLKIPGAWWNIETAEHILALRCVRINGDWELYWKNVNKIFAHAA
jgi:hypothetical protein